MKYARIERWSLHLKTANAYQAPEMGVRVLRGAVYDHPNLPNGSQVTTSRVQEIDVASNRAVTRNTTYTLGEMHPDYAASLQKD